MAKLHMRGSGSDQLTVDWWLLLSDAVINSGPKSPLTRSTNGIRAYFWVYVPAQVNISCTALREASSKWPGRSEFFQIRPNGMQRILRLSECRHLTCTSRLNWERYSKSDLPEGDTDQPKKKPTGRKIDIKGEDLSRYGSGQKTKVNSEACRYRMLAELAKPPEGQRRLQAADERLNRSVAEQIDEQDRVPPVHGGR